MLFRYLLTLAVLAASIGANILPAAAQQAPAYQRWQASWDAYQYDHRHVILGTVASFEPFRLQVARRDGVVQMIDLKDGTVILPTGATPGANERVAVIGYYSKGTFIANRVILHG